MSQKVWQKCEFTYWFFAHYHRNMTFEEKLFLQYDQITMIEE